VRDWAARLMVAPRQVRITAMRRKWASCSTQSRLTFDRDLLTTPQEFRTEAIVHELLHLLVPNHVPLFRALLSATLGIATPARADSHDRSLDGGSMPRTSAR
jgi:hypothetical protein